MVANGRPSSPPPRLRGGIAFLSSVEEKKRGKRGDSDDIGASCLEERARAWKRNCEGWHRERVEKGKRWTRTRNSLLHSDEDKPCGSLHLVYFVEWFAGIWYTLPSPSFSSSLPPSHLSARLVNVRPFVSTPSPLPHVPRHCFYFAAGLADDTMKYVKECVHEVKTFRRLERYSREREREKEKGK